MSISKSLSPKLGASLSSGRSRFNTDDQFALANKTLVPLLQGGLKIDKNNAKSCLSFKISNMLGDEINQINFRIDSSGHVRFMDLDSNDALFSPEGAIEYVCQNSKFLCSLETKIGIELISSNYSLWSPLFKVKTNANAVNMINLLTKEETKFDMVFMPQLKAWRIPL